MIIKRFYLVSVYILTLLICVSFSSAFDWRQEIEIGQGTGHILITDDKPLPEPAVSDKPEPEPVPFKKGALVSVKILRVQNQGGNNPLNQDEPVNNLNNVTYETLKETVYAVETPPGNEPGGGGPVAGPELDDCIGTVPMTPVAGMYLWDAYMDLRPSLNYCRLSSNLSDIDPAGEISFVAGNAPGQDPEWFSSSVVWDVSPAGGNLTEAPVEIMITRSGTGSPTLIIRFRIIQQGEGFDLQILNITLQ